MKKKVLSLLTLLTLVFACAFVLSACDNDKETNNAPSGATQSQIQSAEDSESQSDEDSSAPEHEHNYRFVEFVWAEDLTAQAKFVCDNDNETEYCAATVTNEVTTEPLCETEGVRTYTAAYEDYSDTKTEVIPALGHDRVNHVAKSATCTEIGWEAYETCTRCEYTTYVEIPAAGHTPSDWITTKEPTCTERGYDCHVCAICGDSYDDNYVDAHGHLFTEYVSDDNATYDEDGTKTALCDYGCGATDTIIDKGTKLISNITFKTLSVDNSTVCGKVSNKQTTYSFLNEVRVNGNAKYTLSYDINGNDIIASKTVTLEVGDNVYYIVEYVNDVKTNVFTVTIRRKVLCCVTFDEAGGTPVDDKIIEEDDFAVAPDTERAGYTFVKWNYDFETPITADINIKAVWQVNIDTPYKVEYYLENLENIRYTLTETDNLTGATDTTARAEIKAFAHFTHTTISQTKESGNINGDGSTVLKVYYSRDKYKVTITPAISVSFDKSYSGQYKYGYKIGKITATFNNYIGYEWVGWYCDGEFLTEEKAIDGLTVDREINYVATTGITEEYAPFDFTSDETTCTITGIKDKTVTSVTIPDNVTSIGNSVFSYCSSLTSITIPDNVTSIGNSAFYYCSSLTSLTIPEGVTSIGSCAFYYCSSLTNITIPDSVKSIEYSAFYNCSSLTSVTIGNGVTSIGNSAFSYCSSLTSVTIGNGVTSIGNSVFSYCSSLTSITIPDSVTRIDKGAFNACSSLESITIPFVGAKAGTTLSNEWRYPFGYIFGTSSYVGGVEITQFSYYGSQTNSITSGTYYIPSSLKSVTVTGGNIIRGAFYNCRSLTSVTIGNGVTSIGGGAFNNCSSLTRVYYGGDIANWCSLDFADASANPLTYAHNLYIEKGGEYKLVTDLVIPDSVMEIKNYAFDSCTCITSIIIPDCVTSIGDYAFSDCQIESATIPAIACSHIKNDDLKTVTITSGNIQSRALSNCYSLTNVTISESVTSIGEGAFNGCSSLESITIPFVGKILGDNNPFGCIFGTTFYTGSIYSHYYYIPASLKTVVITGGENVVKEAFYKCKSLTSVTIGNGVKSVGRSAFKDCSNLTSITIPDSVTSIGEDAFSDCPIESATIPAIACSYIINDKLKTIVITSGESIGGGAFYKCYSLTSITIPDSVTSIGDQAFYNCISLTSITFPDSVTSIGKNAFSYCGSLMSVTIPDSVTSIGDQAFFRCISLTGITIPDSVTWIGAGAFSECISLTSVTIGNGVTSIGQGAFGNCSSLTSVTIPDGVTNIGDGAFNNCSSLMSVYYDGDIEGWCNITFDNEYANPLYYAHDFYIKEVGEYRLLTELVIPDTVTEIIYAFRNFSGLTSVIIPDSVTWIGEDVFSYCVSLTSVTIPDSVTSIGRGAFKGCSSLTSVTIPDSVTSIGQGAFKGCSSLTSITIPDSVTSIGDSAFGACSSLESITIPFVGARPGITASDRYRYPFGYIFGTSSYTGGVATTQYYYYADYLQGNQAFYIPSSLKSVTVTGGDILPEAFFGCSSLTSVTIGNGVTSIGDRAFYNCSSLTNVTIPDSVTSIDGWAFIVCSSLTSVYYDGDIEGWCNMDFADSSANPLSYAHNLFIKVDGEYKLVTDLIIPDTVTEIKNYAFNNCSSLTSVIIPNSVTRIGDSAFGGCCNLTAINFNGTQYQWYSISKGSGWRYSISVGIQCVDAWIEIKYS